MTVTVEAGITLAALQAHLAKQGQRVTLDPPGGERATIGGVLATNDSGPMRLGHGTARDIVIGMSMIEPDGELIRSGGRVVKNVAGYDLHKLFIGSFGALGPIATVTLKLRPVPEARGLAVLHPRSAEEAERMIAAALAGDTRPTMIDLLNAPAWSSLQTTAHRSVAHGLTLVIGFEENADAVRWQCDWIVKHIGGTALNAADSQSLYERLRDATGGAGGTSFKATMLSSLVADYLSRAGGLPIVMIARAGNGVVYGVPESDLEAKVWRELSEAATAGQGSFQIWGKLPACVEARFGAPRADQFLSTRVREAFDPTGMFAPERR
jgi:glycolate oxidase FAD binding subunit